MVNVKWAGANFSDIDSRVTVVTLGRIEKFDTQ